MRTNRLLALAGIAVTAISLTGCIIPPHHGHGSGGRDGDDRYERRGDRDGDRGGRWDRGDRPGGPPPGGYGPRY